MPACCEIKFVLFYKYLRTLTIVEKLASWNLSYYGIFEIQNILKMFLDNPSKFCLFFVSSDNRHRDFPRCLDSEKARDRRLIKRIRLQTADS